MQVNYAILTVLWAVLLAILLLMPGDDLPDQPLFEGFDKLVHLSLFGVLSYLTAKAYQQKKKRKIIGNKLIVILLITFIYSLFLEGLQNFIPGRDFDAIDLLANGIGIVVGLTIIVIKNKF